MLLCRVVWNGDGYGDDLDRQREQGSGGGYTVDSQYTSVRLSCLIVVPDTSTTGDFQEEQSLTQP